MSNRPLFITYYLTSSSTQKKLRFHHTYFLNILIIVLHHLLVKDHTHTSWAAAVINHHNQALHHLSTPTLGITWTRPPLAQSLACDQINNVMPCFPLHLLPPQPPCNALFTVTYSAPCPVLRRSNPLILSGQEFSLLLRQKEYSSQFQSGHNDTSSCCLVTMLELNGIASPYGPYTRYCLSSQSDYPVDAPVHVLSSNESKGCVI